MPAAAVFKPSVPNSAGATVVGMEIDPELEAFWDNWLSTNLFGI
ncbi:hypothetical protein [Paenibacillus segetis]|nr:hypothetical protein [Paenibacillus segetis]